jgi:hypothetical protein
MVKLHLKARIGRIAYKYNTLIEDLVPKNNLEIFFSKFRKKYISCDLIRIGSPGDGGYLMPNILNEVSYCFSPGVDNIADFEKELSEKYNIKSFMADASVKGPPFQNKNFEFIPKFLGTVENNKTTTLSNWIKKTIGDDKGNKILQMDIEGGEYDVLLYEGPDTLAKFQVMIIEFHDVHKIFHRDFFKIFSNIFDKIYSNFTICHVHPNNCCGKLVIDNFSIPAVLEMTFIRNDLVTKYKSSNKIVLPHNLDSQNVLKNIDIPLSKNWYNDN